MASSVRRSTSGLVLFSLRTRDQGRQRARERLLTASLLLWLAVTLFWFRAGLDWRGHTLSAVLGFITFAIAFVPSGKWQAASGKEQGTGERDREARNELNLHPSSFNPHPSLRLLRFPPFWLGLAVLLVAGVQIWNTQWQYEYRDIGLSAMVRQPHIEWLPSGVNVPLVEQGNPYTGLLQIMLPWMFFCIVATGFEARSRRWMKDEGGRMKDEGRLKERKHISASQHFSVSAFSTRAWRWLANGALVIVALWTLMALFHYYTGQEKLYGLIEIGRSNRPPYWGTIKDPNHGAFLQMMAMALAVAMGFAELDRRTGRGRRSGLAWFYFALAIFFSFATLQTVSRGAIVLTAAFWLAVVAIGLAWGWRRRARGVAAGMLLFLVILVAGGATFFLLNLEHGKNHDFRSALGATLSLLEKGGEENRLTLNRVAWRYHQAHPAFGTGLGSWGYFYHDFVQPGEESVSQIRRGWQRDPETGKLLRDEDGNRIPRYVPFQFWHTHNDWLQYLCELGWVGFAPLLGLLAWPFTVVLRPVKVKDEGRRMKDEGSRVTGVPPVITGGTLATKNEARSTRKRPHPSSLILLAGIALMGIASLYEFPTRSPGLGLMLALLAGLVVLGSRPGRSA